MQITTTISLPKNLAQEVEKQIELGNFTSRSEFIRSAVRTYLLVQKNQVSWEALAAPFRSYAKQKGLVEEDLLQAVEKGRKRAQTAPGS